MSQTLHLQDGRDPETQARRVFIATPVYEKPAGIYTYSMLKTITKLDRLGIGWEWCLLQGNCHVDDARNTLIRNFRGSKCTDLLFIDADNGWSPDDVVRVLRMDEEFIAGVYPLKSMDDSEWPVSLAPGEIRGIPNEHTSEGLVEVLRAPTGFMRLRRSAVDKMVEAYGDCRYRGGDQRDDLPASVVLFERTFEPDVGLEGDTTMRRWGGDWAFCNRWRKIGGKIYIDPNMRFQHSGPWTWEGSIGEHWREVNGINAQIRKARLDDLLGKFAADPIAGATDFPLLLEIVASWKNPWALPPDQLSMLLQMAAESGGPTLECGSGLSTILLAMVAKAAGHRHYALESNSWYAAHNTVWLRRYGLLQSVEIIPAELESYGDAYEWYAIPGNLRRDFRLLLVDGPPQEQDKHIRHAAIERLRGHLAPGCIVFADDIDQKGLSLYLPTWEREIGGKFHVFKGKPRSFAVGRVPDTGVPTTLPPMDMSAAS